MVLRNPVERAYSHYWMHRMSGRESETFSAALDLEEKRKAMNWSSGWQYSKVGFYADHVTRYLGVFPKEQILITIYDDFVADPTAFMKDIFRFLGVSDDVVPNMNVRYNVAGESKSRLVNFLLTSRHPLRQMLRDSLPQKLRYHLTTRLRQKYLAKPAMPADCRERLRSLYRDDLARLQTLLPRPLPDWAR